MIFITNIPISEVENVFRLPAPYSKDYLKHLLQHLPEGVVFDKPKGGWDFMLGLYITEEKYRNNLHMFWKHYDQAHPNKFSKFPFDKDSL